MGLGKAERRTRAYLGWIIEVARTIHCATGFAGMDIVVLDVRWRSLSLIVQH